MLYRIDLAAYGIVSGSYGKPPYTAAQYTQAKANKDGINSAIAYADANGYAGIILPRGVYTFTYTGLVADTSYNQGVIFPKSNQIIDLGGSTLEMMFDSVNKSPFHTKVEEAFRLSGNVFVLDNVHNVEIRNGEVKGDIYNRSFSNATEKSMEQTYGFGQKRYVYNIVYRNLNVHGFMGDSFTFMTRAFSSNGSVVGAIGAATPGYINSTGVVSQVDGCYISPMIAIDFSKLLEFTPYAPRTVQIQTAGGYTRIPAFANQYIEIVFFNSANAFISKRTVRYLEKIILPAGCASVQLVFTGEAVGLDSLPNQGYTIMEQASNTAIVVNCKIHDNHRGGISNPCDNLIIDQCDIWSNGLDSSIGAPTFPDSTRYAINFEDTFAQNVEIKNCNIYNGYNCLLLGVNNFKVENNIISNFPITGVAIYNNATGVIRNNKFYESQILGFTGSKTGRNVLFEGNFVFNRSQIIQVTGITPLDYLKMNNNFITCNVFVLGGLNTDFCNNELSNTKEVIFDQFQGYTIDVRNFRDNYVNGSARLNRSRIRAKDMRGTTVEGFNDIQFAMDSAENSVGTLSGLTLKSSVYSFVISGAAQTDVPEFSVFIRDCKIVDSVISLPGNVWLTNATKKIKLSVSNSQFEISAKSPFRLNNNVSFASNGIVYEHDFTNTTFQYMTSDYPLLFGSLYAQSAGTFRHRLAMSNVKAINNDAFLSKITIGGPL